VFISVDPERDTAPVLKAYLHAMDPSFVGLRGSLEEVDAAAREFKVFFQKVPTKGDNYTMDHTAGAFLFDPDGQVRLFVRYGMKVEDLTEDIRTLLKQPAAAPKG
jgi:protein SCO1/2